MALDTEGAHVRFSVVKLGPHLDALPLPGGKTIGEVEPPELARVLVKNGIAADAHANGKSRNSEIYDAYLAEIRNEGGEKAVAEWLEQHA